LPAGERRGCIDGAVLVALVLLGVGVAVLTLVNDHMAVATMRE